MHRAIQAAFAALFLLSFCNLAPAKDNGAGLTHDDIERACEAALQVCKAGCQRPNTVSGALQQSFCVDDCYKNWSHCMPAVKATGKSKAPPKKRSP